MPRNVFRIVIQTTNATFDDSDPDGFGTGAAELAFILRGIASRLDTESEYPGESLPLHDTNGNSVGHVSWGDL